LTKGGEASILSGQTRVFDALAVELSRTERVRIERNASLSRYTRFGIGGPAALLADVFDERSLTEALRCIREHAVPMVVIGAGTNLIVADEGFAGVVLRYRASQISGTDGTVHSEAGADLQTLVDHTIVSGIAGMHTLTRIPGWVGAAVYGNAGAYGHSIHEFIQSVCYFDGEAVQIADRDACGFSYRESVFKRRKEWIILSVKLALPSGDPKELAREAARIREIRDAKYPPMMKCAGSIFKNLLMADLAPEIAERVPEHVIREGKVPSAWFLEQAGAKGIRRGDIQVADYHANLVYNDGAGSAADLVVVISELKARVRDMFGLELEEEVQYVGTPVAIHAGGSAPDQ
jgi:UDP-N-acetylmuramate dehydrogenase